MRVRPGGVLGGYCGPQELAFIARDAEGAHRRDRSGREYVDCFTDRPIADYRSTLAADREMHAAFTAELIRHGVVKAAQEFHVSLAHGEQEIEWTPDAVAGALQAVSDRRRRPDACPNSESERRT